MPIRMSFRPGPPKSPPKSAAAPAPSPTPAVLAKQPTNLDYANDIAAFIGRQSGGSGGVSSSSGAVGSRVQGSLQRGSTQDNLYEAALEEAAAASAPPKPPKPPKPPPKLTDCEEAFNRGASASQFAVEMVKKSDSAAGLAIYLEVGCDGLAIRRRTSDAELMRSFPLEGLSGWAASPGGFTFTAVNSKGIHGDVNKSEARIFVRTTQAREISAACMAVAAEKVDVVVDEEAPQFAERPLEQLKRVPSVPDLQEADSIATDVDYGSNTTSR